MKILHITDLFTPSIGGLESHVLTLVRERVRRAHDVSVVTLVKIDGQPSDDIEDNGFRVHRIDAGYTKFKRAWASLEKPYHPPFPDPFVASSLRKIIESEKPDVVQAHNWMAYSYLSIKTADCPPMLWMLHDHSLACPKETREYYRGDGTCPGASIRRCVPCSAAHYKRTKGTAVSLGLFGSNALLLRRADKIVANSSAVARRAEEAVGIRGSVEVVKNFVEDTLVEKADSVPRPAFLPEDDDYILFVGGLGPHKGVEDLLVAHQLLGDDAPPLVVLGVSMSGQPTTWPPGVVVRENVPHAEVMAAWKHCRFAVVPSRWEEPRPLVATEASTMGKAVIATKVGGIPEVVLDGETGILVPKCDPRALANAMRALIGDPQRAAALGAAGKRYAATFTVSQAVSRFDKLLQDLVEAHRRRDHVIASKVSIVAPKVSPRPAFNGGRYET